MSRKSLHPVISSEAGLDLNQLRQSEYFGEREYSMLLKEIEGSLTQVYGNESTGIFLIAHLRLDPNEIQTEILGIIYDKIQAIEKQIDPERLRFTITKAADDEICINRKATRGGRAKIIVNDDGVIALSYLSASDQGDILNFSTKGNVDYEKLVYDFFSF